MATQIKLRRDTDANWTTNSTVVLAEGEIGVNLTNGKFKLGNGTSTWAQLSYFTTSDLSAVGQDILPAVDSDGTTGYTLGSPDFKWKELFVSNGSIYIGDVKLSNVAGKLRAVKVVNPGEVDEEEDPDDSDATSEIGGSGAVVDRAVNFPNGEEGDTEGTLANDNGQLYFCTADYVDFNQYIDTPFSLETNQDFLVGQTGGSINVATISRNANAAVLFILQNGGTTASDWSITMTDGDFGGAQTCTGVGFNVDDDIAFNWSHRNDDPNSIPEGSTFTVTYTGTLDRSAIWERISDNGSNRIEYYDEVLDYTSSVELTRNFRVDVDDAHLEVDGDGYWSLGSDNYDTKIFSTDRTGPNPADIIIRANDNDWAFKSDGGLAFPDGTLQTTAYTGQTSGSGTLYIMANVDGNIVTSTNGTTWGSPTPSGLAGINRVAIHNGVIVYIGSNDEEGPSTPGLYYSTVIGTVELCTGTDVYEGRDVFWNQVRYFDEPNKWVAVGYIADSTNDYPVVAHSTNGISWTKVPFDTQFGAGFNTGNDDWALTDVAYMAETGEFVISSSLGDSESFAGIFITDDVTVPLTGATHVAIDLDVDHTAPWAVVQFGGPPGYMVLFGTNDEVWYGYGTDPENYSLDTTFWTDSILDDIGYIPEIIDIAYDEDGFIAVTADGQVITSAISGMGPAYIVSVPLPYTVTDFSISRANPAVLTYTAPTGDSPDSTDISNNEKIVITGSDQFDGTYYYKASDDTLYTDQELTSALDTSGFDPFVSGGTLTMSKGTYFDAAGTSPNYYYIGNDDEQIFRSTNGITWTQLADVTGGFFNDFAYGTFGSGSDSTVTVSETAPTAANGSLWFNTEEGRLYIKYSDQWVDAAPLVQPPPDTDIDVNSITFADASVLTSVADLTPNKLVNGDNELVLATDGTLTFPGGNISVGSNQGQEVIIGSTNASINVIAQGETGTASIGWIEDGIDNVVVGSNIAAVTVNSPDSSPGTVEITTGNSSIGTNTWTFSGDGNLTLPGAVVNSTVAKTGGNLGTATAIDLTKTVNKLTDGLYTLADGAEGQIMYLVRQTGSVGANIGVNVAHARIDGSTYGNTDHYPFGGDNNLTTLIFTDDHWQSTSGAWDV